ncbi:MAG: hypothetical protein ACODAU_05170 [Myxococcota bacterium]
MAFALRPAVAWLLASTTACAASQGTARVTSAFTEEDAEVFEDGIDFVADPGGLQGPWQESWEKDLQRRVSRADVVATVTVRAIQGDVDLDRQETIRLVVDVDEELLGDAPSSELELEVAEGQEGFESVQGNDRRVLNQPFVAYVKWYRDASGEVRPHWHLAPATPSVVQQTRDLIAKRREAPEQQTRQRVIVHHD